MLTLAAGDRVVAFDDDSFVEASGAPDLVLPEGWRITPGLIDLQVNGLGAHYPLEDPASLPGLDAALASHGVTSYPVAAPSSDPVHVTKLASQIAAFMPGSGCLGLHLEGPVLNPEFRGAHPIEHLRAADDPAVRALLDLPGVRIITLAPELGGALDLARDAAGRGIVVAAGHSGASVEQARAAIDSGITLCTHLFNAMTPVHQRAPGIGIAYLTDPRTRVAFIADGVHLHEDVSRLIVAAARERCLIVSDSAPDHEPAEVLAGSAVALDEGVRGLAEISDFDFAIACASARPAAVLGVGSGIRSGARADFAIWNEHRAVVAAVRAGEFLFRAEGFPDRVSS